MLHQLVHHRVADAGDVLAAVVVDAGAGEEVALLVARREALADALHRHVVVEGVGPHLVLRRVHGADARLHAEALQHLHIGQRHALEARAVQQDLEGEGLALRVHQRAGRAPSSRPGASRSSARRSPSRLLPEPSVTGSLYSSVKSCSGTRPAEALQDLPLAPLGQAARRQFGVGEIGAACAHRRRRTGWRSSTRSRTPRSARARTRASWKSGRRRFTAKACMPVGSSWRISSRFTRPRCTAGKS